MEEHEEEKLREHMRLVEGLEDVFREHFRSQGQIIIENRPPVMLMIALKEIPRGKLKDEYLRTIYKTIVNYYRT
jgi:hypothetical protein